MATRARLSIIPAIFLILLVLADLRPSQAQESTAIPVVVTVILIWPTATDTPEPTEGPSPTPTSTLTPTPDFISEATVEVDGVGQDVAFVYSIDAGQTMTILLLVFIMLILLFGLLVFVRGS